MITGIWLFYFTVLLVPVLLRSIELDRSDSPRKRRSWLLYAAAALAVFGVGLLLFRGAGMFAPKDNLPVLSSPEQMQEALAGEGLVVLDFYSPTCGPCRRLAPIVGQLSRDWAGQVTFYKVNVDASPELTEGYDVSGVPLLVFFRDGRMIDRMMGLHVRSDYDQTLSRLTGLPVPVQADPPKG